MENTQDKANLQARIQEACEKIRGFKEWLDESCRSRIFGRMVAGEKRDIVAIDYDPANQCAAIILQEKSAEYPTRQVYLGVEEISLFNDIGMREVKIYVAEERRDYYTLEYWQRADINKILAPAKRVDIKVRGFRKDHGGLVFEVIGEDSKGVTRSVELRESDDIDRHGAE